MFLASIPAIVDSFFISRSIRQTAACWACDWNDFEQHRHIDILNHIEGKLGSETYQRLVEKIKRQLS
jgi:hypothetical protein